MWTYWFMFLVPAVAAAAERTRGHFPGRSTALSVRGLAWVLAALGLVLLVGYRVEVGGDWFTYLEFVDSVWGRSLGEVLALPDPGYQLLNWISLQLEWGVFGANVMGATIFAASLVVFCRSLPRPWLALTVAIPYLVIVVGMGYSRQGIALALAMVGLVSLQRKSTFYFVLWAVLGATFHKTAVLLLPLGALAHTERRLFRFLWIAVVSAGGYVLFLADAAESLYAGYVEAEYQSEGALVRLLMNAVPAAVLLLAWKRFARLPAITPIWRWFAWLSIALLLVLFATPASTAIDRIALYMLPLQLVVFSSLPEAFSPRGKGTRTWVAIVLLYYGLVLFVWLNFASHSQYWIPYRFYPAEALL
jgi:hypothetical protein